MSDETTPQPTRRERPDRPVRPRPDRSEPTLENQIVEPAKPRDGKVVTVKAKFYPMCTPDGSYITVMRPVDVPLSGWVDAQIKSGLLISI